MAIKTVVRLVKTLKEGYIAFIPKLNVRTALHNPAVAIEDCNKTILIVRLVISHRGKLASVVKVNLRYKGCLNIVGQEQKSYSLENFQL